MPGIPFPQFLKRYGMRVLPVAHDDIVPGAVLGKKKSGFLYLGHLMDIFEEKPEKFWETEINSANLVYGTVEKSWNLSGKASFNQMGVKIDGGLGRAREIDFQISGVHAKTFAEGRGHATMFSLTPLLKGLRKKKGRRAWRMVNDNWIVLETYHALKATVTLKGSGNVDLKGDIQQAGGINIEGGGGAKWKNNRSFEITGNKSVPFAFRGWQV